MGKLTKNGYDYYKTFKCWEPIEAALIVYGIDPCGVNYENIPENVWNIYAQSTIEDTYENPLKLPEKKLQDRDQIRKYEKYCRKFCKDQGVLNTRILTCFEPRFYVSMIKDHFDTFDTSLNVIPDTSSKKYRSKLRWAIEPNYNEKKLKSEFIISPDYTFKEEKYSDKIRKIYDEMNSPEPWTIDEGILLLGCPLYVHKDWKPYEYDGYEHSLGLLRHKFKRAIDGGFLSVLGTDKNKPRNGWRNDYGRCYVNPSEFLEFVRTKKILNIPPELDVGKFSSASVEVSVHDQQQKMIESSKQTAVDQPQNNSKQPEPQQTVNQIDYSKKTKSELKELVSRLFDSGLSRWEIAQKIFPADIEKGFSKRTLMKRVDRLRGISS